ncbi:unnamed protein product [Parajaminaea phylloscopi]
MRTPSTLSGPMLGLGTLLALCLSTFVFFLPTSYAGPSPFPLRPRTFNSTAISACKSIKFTSKASTIDYGLESALGAWLSFYMLSSTQPPTCLVKPTTADDLAAVMKVIGDQRINFAVTAGGHTGNPGFSSTNGILISLKGFQKVALSGDKSYVDIGTGNIWDNVYAVLEGSGVNIVGGRVSGVGVGGFITGGGGYSWLTNQHGLTVDTLQQFSIILPDGSQKTVTAASDPDLFWAIKGGGNQFGIVYEVRLRTRPQGPQVWGGLNTYTQDQLAAVVNATATFSNQNKDPKAQVIPAFNFILGQPGVSLLAFYDGPSPPAGTFDMFDQAKTFTKDWKARTFSDLVRSAPANATAGHRGAFHTVSLTGYSQGLLDLIVSELKSYGAQGFKHSAFFLSYDVEPFLQWPGGDGAWKHDNSPKPLNIYFAWDSPLDDDFWRKEMVASANRIAQKARDEGQKIDDLLLYPNYAISSTPIGQLYDAASLQRLAGIRSRVDPKNVMGLTTFFRF